MLFRAAYGDESRVLLVVAQSLVEAISLANERLVEEGDDDIFTFDSESVFEIDLNIEGQIIDDFRNLE